MPVINTRQRVGMFHLQRLDVKIWTRFIIEIFNHFTFFGIFTKWILIENVCGKVCGPVLSPLRVASFLLTCCRAQVLENLQKKHIPVNYIQFLCICTTITVLICCS